MLSNFASSFNSAVQQRMTDELTALNDAEGNLNQKLSEYDQIKRRLSNIHEKLSHEVMVPIGTVAQMEGSLVNTNKVTVLIGDNWFMDMSTTQAVRMIDRRRKFVESKLIEVQTSKENVKNKYQSLVPKQEDASSVGVGDGDGEGQMVEIHEPMDPADFRPHPGERRRIAHQPKYAQTKSSNQYNDPSSSAKPSSVQSSANNSIDKSPPKLKKKESETDRSDSTKPSNYISTKGESENTTKTEGNDDEVVDANKIPIVRSMAKDPRESTTGSQLRIDKPLDCSSSLQKKNVSSMLSPPSEGGQKQIKTAAATKTEKNGGTPKHQQGTKEVGGEEERKAQRQQPTQQRIGIEPTTKSTTLESPKTDNIETGHENIAKRKDREEEVDQQLPTSLRAPPGVSQSDFNKLVDYLNAMDVDGESSSSEEDDIDSEESDDIGESDSEQETASMPTTADKDLSEIPMDKTGTKSPQKTKEPDNDDGNKKRVRWEPVVEERFIHPTGMGLTSSTKGGVKNVILDGDMTSIAAAGEKEGAETNPMPPSPALKPKKPILKNSEMKSPVNFDALHRLPGENDQRIINDEGESNPKVIKTIKMMDKEIFSGEIHETTMPPPFSPATLSSATLSSFDDEANDRIEEEELIKNVQKDAKANNVDKKNDSDNTRVIVENDDTLVVANSVDRKLMSVAVGFDDHHHEDVANRPTAKRISKFKQSRRKQL